MFLKPGRNLHNIARRLKSIQNSKKNNNTVFCRTLTSDTGEKNILKSPYDDIVIPKKTISEYVWHNLHKWSDRTAVVCGLTGHGYTYGQLFVLSNAFAANLRRKLKLQDGDTVAVMLPNLPEFPLVTLGVFQAGGVMTTISPQYTANEVQRQLLISEAKAIITIPPKVDVVKEALKIAKINIPVVVIKMPGQPTPEGTIVFNELADDVNADIECLKKVRRSPEDIAIFPFSSGTSGLPKGVQIEHRNIIANCEQIDEEKIRTQEETTGSHQDSVMAVLPFFHIYGLTVVMLHKLSRGCKLVTMPAFQGDTFLDAFVKNRVSIFCAAPPLILFMATHPSVSARHYEFLKVLTSGAAPLPAGDILRLFEKAQRKFDFMEGYGLTETSPVVALTRRKDGEKAYGTIGYALPSTEIKIAGAEGQAFGPDQEGELLVRGPQVMRGYHDARANADAFAPGGWLKTGDVASYNAAGELKIVGRLKELIKTKGYQVPPAELEALLREHPEVADAAVVAAPHPLHGEVPRAFVVLKGAKNLNPQDLIDHVAERVAPYKRISHLQFIDSIPKNASGKIVRKTLEEMKLD